MPDLDPDKIMAEHHDDHGYCYRCYGSAAWPCDPYLLAADLVRSRRQHQGQAETILRIYRDRQGRRRVAEHSPTCALLVHHEPCDCHDTPETPTDRAARLALDLGRANRRIAELEAAEGRVRALADQWDKYGAQLDMPGVGYGIRLALDGPPDDEA